MLSVAFLYHYVSIIMQIIGILDSVMLSMSMLSMNMLSMSMLSMSMLCIFKTVEYQLNT
jgi:hypothetical protein